MTKLVMRQCVRCSRNRAERFYVGKRGKICSTCRKRRVSGANRDVRLMENHFITSAEYDELLAKQDGRCAICQGARPYNLDVDHDHAIERQLQGFGLPAPMAHRYSIRGLLCKPCNRRLLPSVKDNPAVLLSAVDYLRTWPSEGMFK